MLDGSSGIPCLKDAAVRPQRLHVARLVQKPEPMPLAPQFTQVLGRVNQLPCTNGRIGVVDGQEATDAAGKSDRHDATQEELSNAFAEFVLS